MKPLPPCPLDAASPARDQDDSVTYQMSESIIRQLEDLVTRGADLVPLGGFDFSGYNARLQEKYAEWRKSCLEALEAAGPIAFPYKTKILGDQNGGYFYQSSAQLIHNCTRELYEKLKSSPDLASAPAQADQDQVAAPSGAPATATRVVGARVLKPPPKRSAPDAAPAPSPSQQPAASTPATGSSAVGNKVYVIAEENDPLRAQLSTFLAEIGLEEIDVSRTHGQMLDLDAFQLQNDVGYAFFIFNSEDLSYAMFELGHFVGKLGKGKVSVLHMSDVNFPKNVPGVLAKPIVVKLEESSLAIMKELKAAGYKISF